ncbi:MAG: T9SS type A sorting domain-containing protein [Chitinophagales bacterium]|nr:T9SS type A sorting domain-containing protein [Chitinophagales bacterium]
MEKNSLLKMNANKSIKSKIAHLKTLGAISGLGFTALVTKEANAQNGMPIYAPPVAQPFGLGDFTHSDSTRNSIKDVNTELVDLDGDNDLDIFSFTGISWLFDGKIIFRFEENVGTKDYPKFTSSNFNPLNLNIDSLFYPISVNNIEFGDLDGDNDLDLFAIGSDEESYKEHIFYFENIGDKFNFKFSNPTDLPFQLETIPYVNDAKDQSHTFNFNDFDNDGDLDIIKCPQSLIYKRDNIGQENNSLYQIVYYENIGDKNNPQFQHYLTLIDTLTFNGGNYFKASIGSFEHYIVDYDNDGDLDIVSWSGNTYYDYTNYFYSSKHTYGSLFENIGTSLQPQFDLKVLPNINFIFNINNPINPSSSAIYSIGSGDIDNDGDIDLMTTGPNGFYLTNFGNYYPNPHAFHFFENLGNSNNTITGTVFHDENSNGMYEIIDESLMPNMVIAYQNKDMPDIQGIAITDTAGKFIIPALNNVYVLKPSVPEHFQVVPSEIEINAADSNYIYEQHFALQPLVSINDLACQITSGPTRPGFVVPFWLTYKNVGTTKRSGTLVFKKNDLLTFNMASSTPDDISADAYAWNFNNLQPFESKTIYVEMTLSATANLGNTLTTILGIIPIPNDANPTNNLDTLNSIIVGSFDPNDKLVTPTGTGVNGNIPIGTQPLEYTVRFQNTGTDTAFNVVVQDSLDLDFDWSTFKILASSHEVTATTRNNNKIKFTFEDIELPHQAVNEPASHGFVKYSLEPKSGLVGGTKFHNTANIYFDYNAPIETNTTVNTFFVPTGVYDNLQLSYRLFPNPMYEKAVLQFDNIFQETFMLRLVDATGKTIKTLPVDGNQVVIERRDLAPGMYIFTLEGQQTISSGKLMVE